MKIMSKDSSATVREQSPHVDQAISTSHVNETETFESNEHDSTEHDSAEHDSTGNSIEQLADIICGAGEEAAAALLVLMRKLEDSTDPQVLVHTIKHCAFTRCGELNVYGLVDAQIGLVETELLTAKV